MATANDTTSPSDELFVLNTQSPDAQDLDSLILHLTCLVQQAEGCVKSLVEDLGNASNVYTHEVALAVFEIVQRQLAIIDRIECLTIAHRRN